MQQLAVHTLGAVVKPADPLLIVVPHMAGAKGGEDRALMVEAMVLNRDAGFVREGQSVEVKLEAYPFTRYGVIPGKIESISRDAVENEEMGLVYVARVALFPEQRSRFGAEIELAPGLAAQAEIKTGERRIIEFLLSPLERRVEEAGRER